ncbi:MULTISPECIES: DUF5787 family protein [Halolamina]|uniref:Uncharacterized protein n=1 Tax=Halolamina pelagica TaxID=699431 RepID=A0A1I5N058_9EURY|nr:MULTISPECIES: DUF5787 family protein [Halolamina]NHX36247.1 hypothetical protein [Halolamina sp. R1-12]SFP15224.1 hypothetical protein SAMN05216277_101495 [Halolamina pelagica]
MPTPTVGSEFSFELLVCRWAELDWRPTEAGGGDASGASADGTPVIVSRQLGTQRRRWDTIVIECDPAGFAARRSFGDRAIDGDLLPIVRHAPAEWAYYRDALPDPGYPWRYVREAIHRAASRGLVDERKSGNRIEIRRKRPYPDWVERIVAVENKPDLDASAAAALSDQLEHDVETALADEVWLATGRTGDRVEPALLRQFPVEAGVLTFDFGTADGVGVGADAATVDWLPSELEVGAPSDQFDAEEKARRRRLIAERAYGKGWRSITETMRPDCRKFEVARAGRGVVPVCGAKGRCQTESECGSRCDSFEPEPPQWRTKGWPIEGGPGQGVRTLLERRRERARDR